jgi:hypothetical protein
VNCKDALISAFIVQFGMGRKHVMIELVRGNEHLALAALQIRAAFYHALVHPKLTNFWIVDVGNGLIELAARRVLGHCGL